MSCVPSLRNRYGSLSLIVNSISEDTAKTVQKTVQKNAGFMLKKSREKNWTEPKIVPKNPTEADMSKEWRVRFHYFNEATGEWKPIIRKGGINYERNFNKRIQQANDLIAAIIKKIVIQGWNPITDTYHTPGEAKPTIDQKLEKLKVISFSDALDYASDQKKRDWSPKTTQDYASVIKFLKQAARCLDIHDKKISEFKLPHYRMVLEQVKELRKLSAKGYNKYREYLSSLVTELVDWEIVELNLVHHVKSKQTIKTVAHRPPTTDQKDLLIGKIKANYRDYYRFLCVLYGCTLRPKEICGLKIKDLHRKEQVFRIIPVKDQSNSKVNVERETSIPNWVMDVLSELNLHNYDPEYYIFSTRNKYGSFTPGKNRMHSNTPTLWWRKIVKEDLKIDIDQYGLKKLSGNDMVKIQRMEGVDKLLELPRQQMGHTTTGQTEVYVTEHLEVMKELVRTKMPIL